MPRSSRNTKQKELISDELDKFEGFFTAEDLHSKVSKKHPCIGIATVYRYLKNLRKEKRLHSYTCDGKLVYSKNRKSHCHFVCEETGQITHFEVDSLDFLKNKIPGTISSFQIEVKGKCNNCNKH